MFQTSSGEDRKSINDSSQALAQNQALEVRNNSLPFIVVWVRKAFKR
jgi:hypothetical protein